MEQVHLFLYANGKKGPPTAVDFDRSLLKEFFFNQSPPKVILTEPKCSPTYNLV